MGLCCCCYRTSVPSMSLRRAGGGPAPAGRQGGGPAPAGRQGGGPQDRAAARETVGYVTALIPRPGAEVAPGAVHMPRLTQHAGLIRLRPPDWHGGGRLGGTGWIAWHRGDVVVHPEQVRRVVLRLDPAEPRVLLRPAEGLDDPIHLIEVEHVDVDPLAGPGREVTDDLAGPTDVVAVAGRVIPGHREVQPEQVLAVREC